MRTGQNTLKVYRVLAWNRSYTTPYNRINMLFKKKEFRALGFPYKASPGESLSGSSIGVLVCILAFRTLCLDVWA